MMCDNCKFQSLKEGDPVQGMSTWVCDKEHWQGFDEMTQFDAESYEPWSDPWEHCEDFKEKGPDEI